MYVESGFSRTRSRRTTARTSPPIILAYPGAVLFSLDGDRIETVGYRETKHYLITRDFLSSPDRFFKHLFAEDPRT